MKAVVLAVTAAVVALMLSAAHIVSASEVAAAVYLVKPSGSVTQVPLLRIGSAQSDADADAPILANAIFRTWQTTGNGWCTLHLNATVTDEDLDLGVTNDDVAYAAGYLEGSLTRAQIDDYYYDSVDDWKVNGTVPDGVANYVNTNWNWTVTQAIAHHHDNPEYWTQVRLVVKQLQGLVDGYQSAGGVLTVTDILYLNLDGDMPYLVSTFTPSLRQTPDHNRRTHPEQFAFANSIWKSKCSSMVRYVDGAGGTQRQLYHAHDTWSSFDSMLRIYKHYQFSYYDGLHPNRRDIRRVSFSSSPGFLSSGDDYYVTHNALTITETTNDIYNDTLYEEIAATGGQGILLTWIRAMIATYNAQTAHEWVEWFVPYLSGTYPNQWIITDMKRFDPYDKLPTHDVLWIVEEIPGNFYQAADVTQFLIKNPNAGPGAVSGGDWPSYNVPYFPEIYERMGFPAMYNQYGNDYSYLDCARGAIFRRDAARLVVDSSSLEQFMQYNQYQTDPLSGGDPDHAIMSRDDLNVTAGAYGGIDSKYTSWSGTFHSLSTMMCAGPTKQTQPVFQWSTAGPEVNSTKHRGQPDRFDFPFVMVCMDPTGSNCVHP